MKKISIVFVLVFLLVGAFFVSSQEQNFAKEVCCEKTKTRGYCQNVLEVEKDSVCEVGSAAATSCDQTSFCQPGVCVGMNTGVCTPNVPKSICEKDGGVWYDKNRDEIEQCKRGCCQVGTSASFVTAVDCKKIATDYGVDIKFRSDITDEATCVEFANSEELGACVVKGSTKGCTLETKEYCKSIKGSFYKGLLCTAPGISDCAKTTNTECFEGRDEVYFLDSCGNRANVYDPKKIKDVEYWKKIQEPTCSGERGCGDCSYAEGSVCEMKNGKGQCKDLSCVDENGEKHDHGESWCAESEGVYADILVDPITQKLQGKTREILENNYEKFNIPGSRYYKLECSYGEIVQEACMDFRNGICKETVLDGFEHAVCVTSTWRECYDIQNKTLCESDNYDCKWIGGEDYYWGYTFNGTIYPYNGENEEQKKIRNEKQGSCVPLYAPGFNFWETEEFQSADINSICSLGSVKEAAVYETSWVKDRDDFEDGSVKSAIRRCFDGACYAIPDYGLASDMKNTNAFDLVIKAHTGSKLSHDMSTYYMSERRGYYCPEKTGSLASEGFLGIGSGGNKQARCARHKSNRADIPLFLNHGVWIDYIQERARSLGDCGYKLNIQNQYGQNTSEVLSVAFQKLTQKGKIDSNKDSQSTKIIYKGDSRIAADEDYRSSGLFKEKKGQSFYWRTYAWWKKLHPGAIPNLGQKVKLD